MGMGFFCYHRDRPGSMALRDDLLEEHWSYMDRYATELIARGPTLAGAGDTPTGSVHIVDLPDPAAARAFAFDEPNYQAGVYRDVLLRRWRNTLGRTMWDFPGGRSSGNGYLVLGLGSGQGADLAVPPGRDELIAYGPLLSDNGAAWLGTAALVRAPDPGKARTILTPSSYADIEVHNWAFGGRPSEPDGRGRLDSASVRRGTCGVGEVSDRASSVARVACSLVRHGCRSSRVDRLGERLRAGGRVEPLTSRNEEGDQCPWLCGPNGMGAQGSCWFAGEALVSGPVDDHGILELRDGVRRGLVSAGELAFCGFVQFPAGHGVRRRAVRGSAPG